MNRMAILDTLLALAALLILGPGAAILAREAAREARSVLLVRSRAHR